MGSHSEHPNSLGCRLAEALNLMARAYYRSKGL